MYRYFSQTKTIEPWQPKWVVVLHTREKRWSFDWDQKINRGSFLEWRKPTSSLQKKEAVWGQENNPLSHCPFKPRKKGLGIEKTTVCPFNRNEQIDPWVKKRHGSLDQKQSRAPSNKINRSLDQEHNRQAFPNRNIIYILGSRKQAFVPSNKNGFLDQEKPSFFHPCKKNVPADQESKGLPLQRKPKKRCFQSRKHPFVLSPFKQKRSLHWKD